MNLLSELQRLLESSRKTIGGQRSIREKEERKMIKWAQNVVTRLPRLLEKAAKSGVNGIKIPTWKVGLPESPLGFLESDPKSPFVIFCQEHHLKLGRYTGFEFGIFGNTFYEEGITIVIPQE